MFKTILLAACLLFPATVFAEDGPYKVIYLAFDEADVAEGKQEPIVMDKGLPLSSPRSGPALAGCEPMKDCFGTFNVPVMSDILNGMASRGWELVSVQPVETGELKGGYLAFLKRTR
jgi:hypothetical protein